MGSGIICVGIATLDRVWFVERLPRSAEKVRSHDYLEIGGGQAANAAVTIARLGGQASLWSLVGGDAAGRTILDQLIQERVGIEHVRQVEGARSISAAILVEASGERSVVADFDSRLFEAAGPDGAGAATGAGAVLADVKWPDGAAGLLEEARRCGVPTIVDIEATSRETLDRLCPLADHAIFSQAGLLAYTGASDPLAGLEIARRRLPGVVGVTLGADGIAFATAAGRSIVAAPRVTVVDTTGAGDAFHGAYALAIAEGRDHLAAARFANAVAALKCAKAGGRAGLPSRQQAEQLMGTMQ